MNCFWIKTARRGLLGFFLAALFFWTSRPAAAEAKPARLRLYIGTYTGAKSKGIYQSELDPATGALAPPRLAAETPSPSYLAIHPGSKYLFAANEIGEFQGKKSGAVSAFSIDPETGRLTLLNQQPSGGGAPCHLVTDREGKHVLAANYTGGSVCVLPVGADGRLGEATAFIQHTGSGADRQRQEGPHAHSINLDAAGRFAFAADLGLDQVLVYRYDAARGTLAANDPPFGAVEPGSGPRQFAFHPGGRFAYAINELKNTVTAFKYDADKGALEALQAISTLPEGFQGTSWCAEVQVHPNGKFLYGSNRGHNSLAVFSIDPDTGKLERVEIQSRGIKTPRHFTLDPAGAWLIAANQDSDSLIVFKIDPATGRLLPTEHQVKAPAPVCVKMMPMLN